MPRAAPRCRYGFRGCKATYSSAGRRHDYHAASLLPLMRHPPPYCRCYARLQRPARSCHAAIHILPLPPLIRRQPRRVAITRRATMTQPRVVCHAAAVSPTPPPATACRHFAASVATLPAAGLRRRHSDCRCQLIARCACRCYAAAAFALRMRHEDSGVIRRDSVGIAPCPIAALLRCERLSPDFRLPAPARASVARRLLI